MLDFLSNLINSDIVILNNPIKNYFNILIVAFGVFGLKYIIKTVTHKKLKINSKKFNHLLFFTALNLILYLSLKLLIIPDYLKQILFFMSKDIFIVLLSIISIRIVDSLIDLYIIPITKKTKSDIDDHLLPILRKLTKFIIIFLTIAVILDTFNIKITSLLTGLGLGGLAFALAAKDLLSNLFGGVSIFIDRPFKIGQRIKVAGIDGTVKEIGIRTTRIKTLEGTEVIIPNSKFTEQLIENVSREESRKVVNNLGLTYNTTNTKIKKAIKILKDIVNKNEHTKNDPLISFTEFKDSSLNLLFIYYIENKSRILETKNEINLEIKKEFEKNKIEFAYPTQTVFLKK